jgi:phage I-like protein
MSLSSIAKALRNRGLFFANEASTEDVVIGQEVQIDVANAASGDGWQMLAPYGDFPHSLGLQRFRKEDAEAIVSDYNSFPNALLKAFGLPFYVGHPDHPAFKGEPGNTDMRAYGRVKKLEARETGLFGNVKWNSLGKELIANEEFHGISPNWRMKREGSVFRPVSLKSVGFTNSPNMPIPAPFAANSETIEKMKKIALALGLPETATEEQIAQKCLEMANSQSTAQTEINRLKGVETEYASKKTEFANAQQSITTLTTERDTARTDLANTKTALETANTNFANARQSHVKLLLDQAQKEGRISQADRTTYETEFANAATFDNALTRLNGAKKNGLPADKNSRVEGDRKRVNDSADRQRQIHEFCNSKMKEGLSYDEAFALAKREKAELFANMQKPGQDE